MAPDSNSFLRFGYKAAIVLAFLGLLASSVFLFVFITRQGLPLNARVEMINAYTAQHRMAFLSTAIFVGMSFGFLGFALFLIQAKGDVEGTATVSDRFSVNITRLSPGLFVILCATCIVITCATFRIEYDSRLAGGSPVPAAPTPVTTDDTAAADASANPYEDGKPDSAIAHPGSAAGRSQADTP